MRKLEKKGVTVHDDDDDDGDDARAKDKGAREVHDGEDALSVQEDDSSFSVKKDDDERTLRGKDDDRFVRSASEDDASVFVRELLRLSTSWKLRQAPPRFMSTPSRRRRRRGL